MGRPRSPTKLKVAKGTFNVTKDKDRQLGSGHVDFSQVGTDAASMRQFASQLEWVTSSDAYACAVLGQLWADWMDARAFATQNDTPPKYHALDRWIRLAGRFGLTPADREVLRSTVEADQDSELEKMLG